jgi:hypothetical protein
MVSVKEFRAQYEAKKHKPKVHGTCPLCEKPITNATEAGEEPQFVKVNGEDVRAHAWCFWEKFGEEIEAHPIGRPTGKRGVRIDPRD